MSDLLQTMIGVLIICLVLFAFWRHGRGNPEGTGSLARKIDAQGQSIAALTKNLEGCATRGSLDLLAEQVRSLEAQGASSGEVAELEARLIGIDKKLEARMDGMKDTINDTREGVRRIEAILMSGRLDRQ